MVKSPKGSVSQDIPYWELVPTFLCRQNSFWNQCPSPVEANSFLSSYHWQRFFPITYGSDNFLNTVSLELMLPKSFFFCLLYEHLKSVISASTPHSNPLHFLTPAIWETSPRCLKHHHFCSWRNHRSSGLQFKSVCCETTELEWVWI